MGAPVRVNRVVSDGLLAEAQQLADHRGQLPLGDAPGPGQAPDRVGLRDKKKEII